MKSLSVSLAFCLLVLLPVSINATMPPRGDGPGIHLPDIRLPEDPAAEPVLPTPSGLRLIKVPVAEGQYFFSWDAVSGAHYYLIHQVGASTNPVDYVISPGHSAKVLTSEQIELYQVQACTAENGCGDLSATFAIDLRQEHAEQNPAQNLPSILPPEQLVALGNQTDCEFSVSWSPISAAQRYNIYSRSTHVGNNPSVELSGKTWDFIGTINDSTDALFTVGNKKATEYAVAACVDENCSELSEIVMVDLINDGESFQCSANSPPPRACDPEDPWSPDCLPCRDAPNCDIEPPPKDNDLIGGTGTGTIGPGIGGTLN